MVASCLCYDLKCVDFEGFLVLTRRVSVARAYLLVGSTKPGIRVNSVYFAVYSGFWIFEIRFYELFENLF